MLDNGPVYDRLFLLPGVPCYATVMNHKDAFDEAYAKLNAEQRQAVDAIDGPVMVIAGPGTGKTQVLALRIANILDKTDTPADGILCLTFTNSGVRAMRERLARLIGPAASRVTIATFHSFAIGLIEKHFAALGFDEPPALIDDHDAVLLADEILETGEWERLRTRAGGAHNFRDLKSLISLLKRERITPDMLAAEIEREIEALKSDPASISSRGASKGQLKKDVIDAIDRLGRTLEAARFAKAYDEALRERGLADYDDVLEYAVRIASVSDDARDSIREQYLYVLVDEHQDSSAVQNEFLSRVWGDVERPNIFAVGDDRQLIYGFGGATLEHFEGFRQAFPGTRTISLVENYRSMQNVLDTADALLASSIVKARLKGRAGEAHPVRLVEAAYPRDEILAAGLAVKRVIEDGVPESECAILVPKNAQVRTAQAILADLGLKAATGAKSSFFSLAETKTLISLLGALAHSLDHDRIAQLVFDPVLGVPPLDAHRFLKETNGKPTLESLAEADGAIGALGQKLLPLLAFSADPYRLVQELGTHFLFAGREHDMLLKAIESVRTMLHLALARMERQKNLTLGDFVSFLARLEEYGQDFPLAAFAADDGVKVMTLHASKGLEYESVWIAHLDEKSLMGSKRMGFALPASVAEKVAAKDELTAKRELYVAITRAKRRCTLSYAKEANAGGSLALARIVADLPSELLEKVSADETEKELLAHDPLVYAEAHPAEADHDAVLFARKIVAESFKDRPVAVTHLNNFFSCPWKWYFRNFLRLPEPESEALLFGSVAHASIEALIKSGSLAAAEKDAVIERELDRARVYDASMRKRFMRDALGVLANFESAHLPGIGGEFSIEKEIRYRNPEIPDVEATGKIDLAEALADGTVRVTDFKTGKVKKKSEIEKAGEEGRLSDMLRQLAMYSYLFENSKEKVRVSSSRLVFVEADGDDANAVYETAIEPEQIRMLENDIKEYAVLLASGEWTARPCDFKPDQFKKECPYCSLMESSHAQK